MSASEHRDGVDGEGNPLTIHDSDDNSAPGQSSDRAADAPGADGGNPLDNAEDPSGAVPERRLTRFQTIMSCLNSLLGAGILSISNSFTHAGIVPSVIILIIVAILSHIATVLTIKLQYRLGSDGLDDLVLRACGKAGQMSVSILSMLFLISAMVAYLIILSGNVTSWLEAAGVKVTKRMWKAFVVLINSLAIPIPMTIPRSVTFIGKLSVLSTVFIAFFCIAMIAKAIHRIPHRTVKPEITIAKFDINIFSAISIYGLAFAFPIVILPLIKPYNPDLRKRGIVSLATIILCFIFVAVSGILGYLLFGNKSESIILDNFSSSDVLIILVRIGFYIVVSLSYPSVAQSVMSSWSQIIFKTVNQGDLPGKKRAIVLILTNIIPLLISMFLPNARPALSIGGALGGCLVDFFFPAFIWIKLSKQSIWSLQNILCGLFALFGVVSAAISTYQAIVDAIKAF